MTDEIVKAYWEQFLSTLAQDSPYRRRAYSKGGYGDSPQLADELIQLVLIGRKTATCSSLWVKEVEGNPLPEVGHLWVELDGEGNPVCITETTEVTIRKYNEVDADFARAEGEGDLSLNYWREAHRRYFSRILQRIGKEFSEDMPLVCERFRVIYQ
jgi:uncharacterized protein YhfF